MSMILAAIHFTPLIVMLAAKPDMDTLPGAKVYQSDFVPLQRTMPDGTMQDALCWCLDGQFLVHPSRWDLFCAWCQGRNGL